jgi:putative sigma-54 modulation protein
MEITITARNHKVPDSLRNQAEYRFDRLARLDRRLTGGAVVFDAERNSKRAEVRATVAGGPPIIGQGEGATLRNALDAALDRMERQLKRRRQRMLDRRSRGGRDRERMTEDTTAA